MAKIKFNINFNATIEVAQKDLKLQTQQGEIINPVDISPLAIQEGIDNGEMYLIISDHINDLQIEDLKVDFQENSFI